MSIAIENHQDFTSADLIELCAQAGEAVGITLDTGNSFPVGEAALDFARTVAPRVLHVHLKDYRVQPTARATGSSAAPSATGPCRPGVWVGRSWARPHGLARAGVLGRATSGCSRPMVAGYPAEGRTAAGGGAARRAGQPAPGGRGPPDAVGVGLGGEELVRYERDMMVRSAANVRALGLMEA